MGVSRREYARRRGCSESAVRKAIASGRITPEPDGTIDPEKADAQWAARSDPAQQRRGLDQAAGPAGANGSAAPAEEEEPDEADERAVSRAALGAVADTLRESGAAGATGGEDGGDLTYVNAKTANEVLKAQTQRVRLQKMLGELVDRDKAIAAVFTLARRERDAWVGWPARVAALIAGELEVDAHRVETVLEKHVRQHLAELGDVNVELGRED